MRKPAPVGGKHIYICVCVNIPLSFFLYQCLTRIPIVPNWCRMVSPSQLPAAPRIFWSRGKRVVTAPRPWPQRDLSSQRRLAPWGPGDPMIWVWYLKKIGMSSPQIVIWLVVDLPLWKIWKSVGVIIPKMFQTTNQLMLCDENDEWTPGADSPWGLGWLPNHLFF